MDPIAVVALVLGLVNVLMLTRMNGNRKADIEAANDLAYKRARDVRIALSDEMASKGRVDGYYASTDRRFKTVADRQDDADRQLGDVRRHIEALNRLHTGHAERLRDVENSTYSHNRRLTLIDADLAQLKRKPAKAGRKGGK